MKRLLFILMALTLTTATARAQFKPGQPVDASTTMSDQDWQSGCTFLDGPHAENDGNNRVKCGSQTYWIPTRWIRASTASTSPGAAGAAAPSRPPGPGQRGAGQPSTKPCAADSTTNCE